VIRPVRPEDAEELGLVRRYLRINGDWRDFFLFQRVEDG
jgi:RimJ/RimL family protein N-acetyltransferase